MVKSIVDNFTMYDIRQPFTQQKNPVLQQNNRDHVGVTKQTPSKIDHEYAVVNKKNQKASYVISCPSKRLHLEIMNQFLVVLVFLLPECGTIYALPWSI